MKDPRISIVLPTYNGVEFLTEAIDSVLNQTVSDLELVIGDDRSTDGTRELLEAYAKRDQRVSVVFNDTNVGYVRNQVATFKRCRGEYIKTYAQDDALAPTCCEVMLNAFEENPTVSLVCVSRQHIDEKGNKLEVQHKFDKTGLLSGREMIKLYMREFVNKTGNPTQIMFRRKDADNGFNAAYNHGEDTEFALRLLEKGDFYYIAEPLILYRIHSETTTIKTLADMSFMSDHVRFVERFGSYLLEDGATKDEIWEAAIQGLIAKMGHALFTRGVKYDDFPLPANWDKPKPGDDFENDEPEAFRRLACHMMKFITEKSFAWKEKEQELAGKLVVASSQNEALQKRIKDLENQLRELGTDNSELKKSNSWKLTAPLRTLHKYVSKSKT
jgi:glycosyltransferase involved in cell wall biosynthesis